MQLVKSMQGVEIRSLKLKVNAMQLVSSMQDVEMPWLPQKKPMLAVEMP